MNGKIERREWTWPNISVLLQTILVVALVFPLAALFLIPILIWRAIVKFYGIYFKNLDSPLTSLSSMFGSVNDIYGPHLRTNIVFYIILDGEMTLERLRQSVLINAVNLKRRDGSFIFKELQMRHKIFLGYLFYKKDTKFNLDDHVRLSERNLQDEEDVLKYVSDLKSACWRKNKSLWEILLVPKFGNSSSSIIFARAHHSLCDGYSLVNLFRSVGKSKISAPTPCFKETTPTQKFLRLLSLPFKGTYQYLNLLREANDKNDLHKKGKTVSIHEHVVLCNKIPSSWILEIMALHNVSFSSVICAAICGGLRKYMLESEMEIPPFIHAISSIPYPGHPENLTNHFTIEQAKLPVGESGSIERLRQIAYYSTRFRNSSLPLIIFNLHRLIGSQCARVVRYLTDNVPQSTAIVSNFPLSNNRMDFLGIPILDAVASVGSITSHTGISVLCLSYNGNLRIVVSVDGSIIPTLEKCAVIARYIYDEVKLLRKQEKH